MKAGFAGVFRPGIHCNQCDKAIIPTHHSSGITEAVYALGFVAISISTEVSFNYSVAIGVSSILIVLVAVLLAAIYQYRQIEFKIVRTKPVKSPYTNSKRHEPIDELAIIRLSKKYATKSTNELKDILHNNKMTYEAKLVAKELLEKRNVSS